MADDIVSLKRCTMCKQEKPATTEYFNRMKSSKDGLHLYCRDCQRQYDKGRNKKAEHARKLAKTEMIASGVKVCSICKEEKPLTEFYKGSKSIDGRKSACKDCYSEAMGWERQPRKQFPPAPEGFKYCRKCEELKPVERFPRVSTRHIRDGRDSYCTKCNVAENRIRHGYNPKVYDNSPDGFKRCTKCKKVLPATEQYFSKGSGRYGLQVKCKTCHSNYQKENRVRFRSLKVVSANKRRARKLALPATFTEAEWQECLNYWDHRCAVCGEPADFWKYLAQDHWISVRSKHPDNPGTVAENIVPLCHTRKDAPAGTATCNISKGSKEPEVWLVERYGKRKAKQIIERVTDYFEIVKQRKALTG